MSAPGAFLFCSSPYFVPRPYDWARWAGAVHAMSESTNCDGPERDLTSGILLPARSRGANQTGAEPMRELGLGPSHEIDNSSDTTISGHHCLLVACEIGEQPRRRKRRVRRSDQRIR